MSALPIGNKPPSTESQARELTKLDDAGDRLAAWTAAFQEFSGDGCRYPSMPFARQRRG